MTVILVPYHQDERLSDGTIPLPWGDDARVVAPDLPQGDSWARLAALDDAAAEVVAVVQQVRTELLRQLAGSE